MGTKTATARLEGDGLRLVALTGSGHTVVMDNTEGDTGPRPSELLVVAQAGCTAMDVASILRKKRQAFTRYEVRVAADQGEGAPHAFERMRIVHVIEGDVEIDAVRRAIELSATKYCTVTGNLASGVTEIHHAYVVRDAAGDEHDGEVVVTGPGQALDAIGAPAVARSV
jgi:putative redox protein